MSGTKSIGYGNVALLNNNHESIILEAVQFVQSFQTA